jgi:mannose-6-phosphate isomerase-like protein (cupin superfamily)
VGEPLVSALQVRHQSDVEGRPGVIPEQTYQTLIGVPERPTDRVRVGRARFVAGALERLHWHPVEAFYYVVSGSAVVRDIEGNEHPVGPGSFVYAPAGIEGAHEWVVEEDLELLDIRATNETHRKLQFTVDRETLRSYIDVGELDRREGRRFPSHY